jgi:hypothetical protein
MLTANELKRVQAALEKLGVHYESDTELERVLGRYDTDHGDDTTGCVCDSGWTGATCGELNLMPADMADS